MRYLSVCSGIEAATVAWHPLGWAPAAFSEIEAFPRAVLAHHYPSIPCHGDFTTIGADEYGPIDLLVGGTPCQSFSIAGLRGGMADDRGNLALEYLRLADRKRPRWLVWENVPGVLSSDDGRCFGSFLGALVELGYGFAYRVLDAQFFGVAQRRRRVFVVGYLGDWRRAAAVLFERHSLQGHPAPRREKGQESTDRLGFSAVGSISGGYGAKLGTDESYQGSVIAVQERAISDNPDAGPDGAGFRDDGAAYTLEARSVPQAVAFNITPSNSNKDYNARESQRAQAVTCGGNRPSARGGDLIAFGWQNSSRQGDSVSTDHTPSLDKSKVPAVAFAENQRGELYTSDVTNSLSQQGGKPGQGYAATLTASTVRRLTPRECERLQGFPDGYTLVPYRGKPASDGPRYKALGNSMAVPVMSWIGRRIAEVETLAEQRRAA